jgi:hypothetical protein
MLLMATLVWGGCVSCPKFFMFSQDEKSCCKKSGECEKPMKPQPVKEECSKLSFAFGSTDSHELTVSFVALAAVDGIAPAVLPAPGGLSVDPETGPPRYSPPPLFLKHSAFLI